MTKRRRTNRTTRQKLERSRRIVVLCMRIAKQQLKAEIIDLIAAHVVAKLPANHMRRLVKGDFGKPMLEAMKLTVPCFAS
jgi:hypothetical protein